MKTTKSHRYLGDMISASGSYQESIEDRRNKGWGKLADINASLSQMPDIRKVEIGLRMREAKLINGMIYSTEAWSKLSDREINRLEQVDMALLRGLVEAHSKCSKAFILLEFGVLSFRHLIMIRRIMFHHHLVNRDNKELIKKIYLKQTKRHSQGRLVSNIIKRFYLY